MDAHQQVAQWLQAAERAVVFTGAGVSTESGIPDYRGTNSRGAITQSVEFDVFLASEEARFEYWQQKCRFLGELNNSGPNLGHTLLAQWEAAGKLRAVITQNIDGLHQLAGSTVVIEVHGTVREIACLECEHRYDAGAMCNQFLEADKVPSCDQCGGLLKHATISFGQSLEPEVLESATTLAQAADLFLVLGSSRLVEPANSLPGLAQEQGARVVIVNRDETPLDGTADQVFHESIGATLEAINGYLQE